MATLHLLRRAPQFQENTPVCMALAAAVLAFSDVADLGPYLSPVEDTVCDARATRVYFNALRQTLSMTTGLMGCFTAYHALKAGLVAVAEVTGFRRSREKGALLDVDYLVRTSAGLVPMTHTLCDALRESDLDGMHALAPALAVFFRLHGLGAAELTRAKPDDLVALGRKHVGPTLPVAVREVIDGVRADPRDSGRQICSLLTRARRAQMLATTRVPRLDDVLLARDCTLEDWLATQLSSTKRVAEIDDQIREVRRKIQHGLSELARLHDELSRLGDEKDHATIHSVMLEDLP